MLHAPMCLRCGRPYNTVFSDQTMMFMPQGNGTPVMAPPAAPAPSAGEPWYNGQYELTDQQRTVKVIAWVLFFIAFVTGPLSVLFLIASIILAVWLICQSRFPLAKKAGWCILGTELAVIVGLLVAAGLFVEFMYRIHGQ